MEIKKPIQKVLNGISKVLCLMSSNTNACMEETPAEVLAHSKFYTRLGCLKRKEKG